MPETQLNPQSPETSPQPEQAKGANRSGQFVDSLKVLKSRAVAKMKQHPTATMVGVIVVLIGLAAYVEKSSTPRSGRVAPSASRSGGGGPGASPGTGQGQESGGEAGQPDAEGTWRDPDTGLVWQILPAKEFISAGEGERVCSSLGLAGGGWRVPNIDELRTLVRRNPTTEPGGRCNVQLGGCLNSSDDCMDGCGGGEWLGKYVWRWPEPLEPPLEKWMALGHFMSSTPVENRSGEVFYVDFETGRVGYGGDQLLVRCCRGEMQSPQAETTTEQPAGGEEMPGVIINCKEPIGYNVNRYVIPADTAVARARFPQLMHDPCLFFAFADADDDMIAGFDSESLGGDILAAGNYVDYRVRLSQIPGFQPLLAELRSLDRYSLPGRIHEARTKLAELKQSFVRERALLYSHLFWVGPSDRIELVEDQYYVDDQVVVVDLGGRRVGGESQDRANILLQPKEVETKTRLARFVSHRRSGNNMLEFPVPLDIARSYFPRGSIWVEVTWLLAGDFSVRELLLAFVASGEDAFYIKVTDVNGQPEVSIATGNAGTTAERLGRTPKLDVDGNSPVWIDLESGLMWEVSPSDVQSNFSDHCSALELGGFTDWRVPTIMELRSLVRGCALTRPGGACNIGQTAWRQEDKDMACSGCGYGDGLNDRCFWPTGLKGECKGYASSDQSPGNGNWKVDFGAGEVSGGSGGYVRCCRSAR